ncbi:MAG: translation initiation factor IF-2 subunit gamma [Nanoarchaeota archaeon]
MNIGLVGHVDHGKTTLTQALSGRWTDTHSEEIKRGITIRLGYADSVFYKCSNCNDPECYSTEKKCPNCGNKTIPVKKISFVDAPGHETLMATMLSGAAIMDAAILLVSAAEQCPQPQTKEHLVALSIVGVKNIIIVQNKIDLVTKEQALNNYNQIKIFIKGTIAENSPIIPISAQHRINVDLLIKNVCERFETPVRDPNKDSIMFIARSFDINKPGAEIDSLVGGVLGGALKQGTLKTGEKIEIRPGLKVSKEGKTFWEPIITEIIDLRTGEEKVDEVGPGGSIGVLTKLDPSLVKSDSLTGNVVGHINKLPRVWYEFYLQPKLLERIVGTEKELVVDPIKKGEILMLNVNSAATIGTVVELKKNLIYVKLKISVCADKEDRITISRMLGSRWRLIGYSNIVE